MRLKKRSGLQARSRRASLTEGGASLSRAAQHSCRAGQKATNWRESSRGTSHSLHEGSLGEHPFRLCLKRLASAFRPSQPVRRRMRKLLLRVFLVFVRVRAQWGAGFPRGRLHEPIGRSGQSTLSDKFE